MPHQEALQRRRRYSATRDGSIASECRVASHPLICYFGVYNCTCCSASPTVEIHSARSGCTIFFSCHPSIYLLTHHEIATLTRVLNPDTPRAHADRAGGMPSPPVTLGMSLNAQSVKQIPGAGYPTWC